VQEMGAKHVTFGATPAPEFQAAHNIPGVKAKAIAHTYAAITKSLRLLNKSEFKEKLGAVHDADYICYPPRGLGPMAVRAILKFFGANEDVQDEQLKDVRMSEDTSGLGSSSALWSSPGSTPRQSMDGGRPPPVVLTNGHAAAPPTGGSTSTVGAPASKRSLFRKSVDLMSRGRRSKSQSRDPDSRTPHSPLSSPASPA